MKKVRVAIGIALLIFISVLSSYLIYLNFDEEEARQALGETYDLSDQWTLILSDGSRKTVSLPCTVPAKDAKKIVLEHVVSEDYANLTLNFYAENVALRASIGNSKIFDKGYTSVRRGFLGRWKRGENNGTSQTGGTSPGAIKGNGNVSEPAVTEGKNVSEPAVGGNIAPDDTPDFIKNNGNVTAQEAVGEVLIDFPNTMSGSKIELKMAQVVAEQDVVIHSASVAKRDITLIGILRNSMFPIVCCILIIICLAVLIMIDVFRTVTSQHTKGLQYMIFLGIVMLIYGFVQTDILYVFFGNQKLSAVVTNICCVVMPVLLVLYYRRVYGEQFPKRCATLMWIAIALAVTELSLDLFVGIQLNQMSDPTLCIQLLIIAVIIHMLVRWRENSRGKIWMDIAALACLAVSVAVNPIRNRIESDVLDVLRIVATTLCFFFIALKYVRLLLREHSERIREDARKLAEQIKLVEERNELLIQAKQEAEDARQEAVVANEAKGRFLASMSHEIRTPINAVLGMDEMILRESREKGIRDYAMDIYTAGQTLLSLINDILDLSKIESGKMEIVPVEYDVCSMIHDLVNMISQRARAKDLKFEVSVDSNMPSRLFGDDVRIRQILTNILTNAVKYTPSGTVRFCISGTREGEYEILHCEVADTGIGIKEEDLPKLFEEFRRIEENRNRNIEGTGLGMNITVQMLALMDSKLRVESTYGKGSRFYFDLRQKVVEDTPVGDFESRLQNLSENYHYTQAFCAPDAHILVVDDNGVNRKVFSSLLKATQIQVSEAGSGMECLDLVSKNHYDIIFLDHMMPEMDGIETLHRIRNMTDFPCRDTPVYVLTANAVTGAREQYLAEGFDGFLSKPIISDKLEQIIRQTLPPELMREAPEGEGDLPEENTGVLPENLPDVDGLDWNYAWLHLPDAGLLETTIKEFYDVIELHAARLDEMYAQLSGKDGTDSYRIQVHAMKSTAATVGITPLAGMAKILEYAARDNEPDKIRSMHDIFVAEWRSYKEKLSGVFGLGKEDGKDKRPFDPDVLKSFLEMVRLSMEDFDVDGADAAMEQIREYSYPDAIQDKILELQAAVTDIDDEGASAIIDELIALCNEKI